MAFNYKNTPNRCPFCETNMLQFGDFHCKDKDGQRTVTCTNSQCGAEWIERFTMCDIKFIKNPFKQLN